MKQPLLLLAALLSVAMAGACGRADHSTTTPDSSVAASGAAQEPDAGEGGTSPSPSAAGQRQGVERWMGSPSPHPPGAFEPELGFYVRAPGRERFHYIKWESEATLNRALELIKRQDESCEILLLPGEYEIHQRIFVNEVKDLTITGSPGTYLYFKEGPDKTTFIKENVDKGSLTMLVEHPERMEAGRRYQVYREDGRHDRILEFAVKEVVDGVVHLQKPAHYFPHVKEVPPGSQIMEELNFFRVRQCPGFTLQGVTMDGRHRGGIRGHTIYTGVHANGFFREHERAMHSGFTVRNCTFKNLKGRGVVFYGLSGGLVEGNYFEHIGAQAIEIDHFSSGVIRNNHVNGAEVGVMVNDAYESIVECNTLRHCGHAVRFLEIYDDPWVNSGNIIRDNVMGPGCRAGVMFFNEGMNDNLVTGNRFLGLGPKYRVVNGEGNRIELVE